MVQLTEDQVLEIREMFFFYGRRGTITTKQLGNAMRFLGQKPTKAELQDIISNKVNPDNETIGVQEFLNIMSRRANDPDSGEELKAAFRAFDNDNSGFISAADLHQVMTSIGENFTHDGIECMIQEVNHDGDGKINYEEFVEVLEYVKAMTAIEKIENKD